MKLIAWVMIGLVTGLISKALWPRKYRGGFLATIPLGIVGAVIGGFLGSLLFDVTTSGSLSVAGLAFAIAGSILMIVLWSLVSETHDSQS